MQRLVMIRHALTISNQLGPYAGRSNDGIDAGAVNGTFKLQYKFTADHSGQLRFSPAHGEDA
jgi:hypothetical protein